MFLLFLGIVSGHVCNYDQRREIYLSYLSETLEVNKNLTCDKCLADCESQRLTLLRLPNPEEAMLGRSSPVSFNKTHWLLQTPIVPPYPSNLSETILGMGCF